MVGVAVLVVVGLHPSVALAILDGEPADTCALPATVYLRAARGSEQCSASYIGGRVLITAAHCFDALGYQLDHQVFLGRSGTVVYDCQDDQDCPIVEIAGQPQQLLCETDLYGGHPATPGECYLPDLAYNNGFLEARFGEAYDPSGIDHPANIVPIDYCHIAPGYVAQPNDLAADFAYCILREEPDVQPVPIMMHCEVDTFLNGDFDLDVMVAGFGRGSEMANTEPWYGGRKRLAMASTGPKTFASSDPLLHLVMFTPFVPGTPAKGDSGGPVLVRLPPPHDTWRVFGVLVKPFTATPPWRFVEWMLEDPAVEAAAILPCHDSAGGWQPGPGCASFPRAPQVGAGSWAYGPRVCDNLDVGGFESSCGAPYGSPQPPAPNPDPRVEPPVPQGCAIADSGGSGAMVAVLGLMLLASRRRRLRGGVFTMMVMLGCSSDQGSDGSAAGSETGGSEEPEPIVFNPEFHGVHAGLVLPGAAYDQIAVGNVSRPLSDTSCCQDIVVGGPESSAVELFFGGGSVERGLTFLAPRASQTYEMTDPADGVRDLALADLDDDGYHDLVVVSTGGQLGVRRGQPDGGDEVYFGPLELFDAAANVAGELGRLALGQLDCDDDLDVVIAAPGGPGIVTLLQTGPASFGPASFEAAAPAEGEDAAGMPRDVAVGEFDGAAPAEIVTANGDGTATFYRRNGCNGGLTSDPSRVFYLHVGDCSDEQASYCLLSTDQVRVLTDDVYCDTPTSDVTLAYGDRVEVWCNQDGFVGPNSVNALTRTHEWDINGVGSIREGHLRNLSWWPDAPALYAHNAVNTYRLAAPGTALAGEITPTPIAYESNALPLEIVLVRHTSSEGAWWQRVIWISTAEGDAALGFVR